MRPRTRQKRAHGRPGRQESAHPGARREITPAKASGRIAAVRNLHETRAVAGFLPIGISTRSLLSGKRARFPCAPDSSR